MPCFRQELIKIAFASGALRLTSLSLSVAPGCLSLSYYQFIILSHSGKLRQRVCRSVRRRFGAPGGLNGRNSSLSSEARGSTLSPVQSSSIPLIPANLISLRDAGESRRILLMQKDPQQQH